MAELAPKKQRNCAIDFWRVYCTLAVAIMHFQEHAEWDGLLDYTQFDKYPPFYRGGLLLEFFLLTGGYFMIASYRSKQKKGLTNIPAHVQAWKYAASRFQAFWPPLFLSAVYAITLKCVLLGVSLKDYFTTICVNVWEFTGLAETGAMGAPASLGGNWQNNWEINPARVLAANYPVWYLSALIITSVVMYYLLAENEGRFQCVWAPFFTVTYLAAFGFTDPSFANAREQLHLFGLPTNIFWALGGLSMGALLFYFVEWLKKKEIGKKGAIFLTVLNGICTAFLLFASITNYFQYNADIDGSGYYNEQIFTPAMAVVIVCNMLNKDYVTKLLNIKFMAKLGEYSLYYFVVHYPTIMLTQHIAWNVYPTTNFGLLIAIYVSLTAITGGILMFVCKKWLIPMIGKFFADPKPSVPAEAK